MLYSGGFFSDSDRRAMDAVRASSPDELASASFVFEDQRLPEMLFRYRARNFPQCLSVEERARWEAFRFQRLTEPEAGASICMEQYLELIEHMLASGTLSAERRSLLAELQDYGDQLLA